METFKTIDECFYLIQNGANIKQGQINGGYPITRIETISNDKFNRDKVGYAGIFELGKYASYVLEDGDLLMSHINSPQYLGRTVLYKKKDSEIIIHGMNLLRLKANVEIINPAFARYLFYSVPFRRQIAKITKKSVNQASFSINDLKKISIVIPSLSVQEKIVKKLNSAISVKNYYERQIELLDELVKARFVEMFGNPANNPYNFSKMKLGKICDVRDGTHDSPKYQTVGYPLITSKNLTSGEIDFSNCNYIKEEDYKKINLRSEVTRGDIIMPMIGTIGNPIIVNTDIRFAIKNVALIKFNNNTLQNIYVKYFLGSDYFDFSVLRNIRGGTQKFIALKDLRDLDILVPPLELQNQFASFVQEVDKSRSRIQKSLEASQELFDSLMQEYFG